MAVATGTDEDDEDDEDDVHIFSFQPLAIPSDFLLQIMFKTIGLLRILPSLDQLQCMHLCF